MKIVIFGLTVSSSWGNGHATLWRGLCRSLAGRGHRVTFFEHDVPYYANSRDLTELPGGGELIFYSEWNDITHLARDHVNSADAAMVTSYCPDGIAASELVLESGAGLKVFYDLDAPVTLARLERGENVEYVGPRGFRDFDLVLSYTGGRTLGELQRVLGAKRVAPLYGSVDPAIHKPAVAVDEYRAELSWMGTYSKDRDDVLRRLFVEPARRLPDRRFVLGGSQYDGSFPWLANIFFLSHIPPARHPAFYASSRVTLNVTRRAMAEMGFCPSGRLFEAAACGAAVLSDNWDGLPEFYAPSREIMIASTADDVVGVLDQSPEELNRIGRNARERTLAYHTADHRAAELEQLFETACFQPITPEASTVCGA
jgi:spore maturation protein CgeB